jgi:hypothetical protein
MAWVTCGLCGHKTGYKSRQRLLGELVGASGTAEGISDTAEALGLVPDDPNCSLLGGNTLLGAVDLKLPIRAPILLVLSTQYLTLNAWTADAGGLGLRIPLTDIDDVQIGGPGLIQTGGGFIGGGFGAKGALEGIALASVLNTMTIRSTIETIVAVTARHASFVLLQTLLTPPAAEIRLLPLTRAANQNATAGAPQPAAATADPAERLRQLAELHSAGLLTDSENDEARRNAARALINGAGGS